MPIINLKEDDKIFPIFSDIISYPEIMNYLSDSNSAFFIIITHKRAKQWPIKNEHLENEEAFEIPIIWALLYLNRDHEVIIQYGIHLGKCFPSYLLNIQGQNELKIIAKGEYGIQCGCIYPVEMNHHLYLSKRNPEYCSVFGIPDSCFFNIEPEMIESLKALNVSKIYCFLKSEYLVKISDIVNLTFIQGELLPTQYYSYIDTPNGYLRAIFPSEDLEQIRKIPWYVWGTRLIAALNPDNDNYFEYEGNAIFLIEKAIKAEFFRQLILVKNIPKFERYSHINPPDIDKLERNATLKALNSIVEELSIKNITRLNSIIEKIIPKINFDEFKKSRVLLLDIEYLKACHPDDLEKEFNFPAIICNLTWSGIRKGFELKINILPLPCNYCKVEECSYWKKKHLKFDCIPFAQDFCEHQYELQQDFLNTYSNAKLYSYGNSDFFAIEKMETFFMNSDVLKKYTRKNHKREKRIPEIAIDLKFPGKSIYDWENSELLREFPEYQRMNIKLKAPPRYLTLRSNPEWELKYRECIQTCIDDTFSLFFVFLYKEFLNVS